MPCLRSPQKVTGGLDWGIANLELFAAGAKLATAKPYWQPNSLYSFRPLWADYLDWYGQVLVLPIPKRHRCFRTFPGMRQSSVFWLQGGSIRADQNATRLGSLFFARVWPVRAVKKISLLLSIRACLLMPITIRWTILTLQALPVSA